MKHRGHTFRQLALAIVTAGVVLAAADAGPALSASFTVNATHDAVDAAPGDGVCADAGGACTLRAAVMETNALPGHDGVTLLEGTYTLTIPGTNEDASASGDLDFTDELFLFGTGSTATVIIDGGGLERALHHARPPSDTAPSPTVLIAGLSVMNGNAALTNSSLGGGLYNEGVVIIEQAVIASNNAELSGGGIYNDGELAIRDSRIETNTAGSDGGAIYNKWHPGDVRQYCQK
jgi:CSLREA domain-containing protein